MGKFSRRDFFLMGAGTCAAIITPSLIGCDYENDSKDSDGALPGPGENPGLQPADLVGGRNVVYVVQGDELSDLYTMAKQSVINLGITKNSLLGSTVFIKPNLVSLGLMGYVAANGECTKAEILTGIAEQCLEAKAAKVVIGDGGQGMQWDWSTLTFLGSNSIQGATNLAAAVDWLKTKYGDNKIELACLNAIDEWEYIPSCSDHEFVKNGLMVARHFYEADHVISAAVIKSHMWAQMTGSMKNFIGITPVKRMGTGFCRSKVHLAYSHASCAGVGEIGVAGAFLDAVKWRKEERKEDFALIDCSIGVEGSGPHTPPVNPGITIDIKSRCRANRYFMLAGRDFAAVDTVASRVMNFNFEIKQLTAAENLGLFNDGQLWLQGANLSDLIIPDWKKPHHLSDDFFKPIDELFG